MNTHFSLDGHARLSNAAETLSFVTRLADTDSAVLMGDFNAEPRSTEIRALTGSGDLVDAWVLAHGIQPGFTYASFNPVRRIDYVMLKNVPADGISARLIGTEPADGAYPSDHLGILADLPAI